MASTGAWLGETPAAWMTPVTLPRGGGGLDQSVNRLSGGDVDGGGADVEAGVGEDLGGGVGVLLAQVGQQDVFAGADPPGDGLADLSGSDGDDDFAHGAVLSVLADRSRTVTVWAAGPVTWPTMVGP
jgi:hypothetical protein